MTRTDDAQLGTPQLETRNSPLAIVGIGCLFPKADGLGYFWANVKAGTDGIGPVPATHWSPDDYFDADPKRPDMTYARRGGFLSAVEFDPREFGIPPRDIEATDTTQLLGLVAAKRALQDANVRFADGESRPGSRVPGIGENGTNRSDDTRSPVPDTRLVSRDRVSVILGVTGTLELVIPLGARLGHPKWKRAMKDAGASAEVIEDAAARIAESYVPWQENSFPGLLGNVVAGRIANKLDLGGTNCVVDAACASSLSAVHLAALELQAGRADVVVTGGADTFNDIFMFMCFSKTPALSATGDAKPFDANGDGTILGEGLGLVVLKRLADAERDGDRVYAVLKGIGSSSDGKGNAIYAPSAKGQVKCLRNAYRAAGVSPSTVELVEAHGTGTKVGDTVEITALTEVYGEAAGPRPWCAIGSVKSQIGHTKAAAGAASLIKAALSLYNKVLPPTLKVTQPVEPLRAADSPFYVNTAARPWLPRADHPRRAALSAFGFGGSNFHAVLEEHTPQKREPDWDGSVEIVALGGATPAAVAAELAKVPTADWPAFARFAEASRGSFDVTAACRLTFAAHRDRTDLPKLVAGAAAKLADAAATNWRTPEGAYFGRGPAAGKLAVLFPGQGSQYPNMLRDLACLFPEVLESVADADRAVAASHDDTDSRRLSDRVFPPASFAPDAKARQEADLRDTRAAQPGIGGVSFGAWRVLHDRFGLAADAFAGHSYGELVALAAAGRVAPADLFTLSRLRGELMARRRDGDPGTMLAVHAPLADVEAALGGPHGPQVVLANRNSPAQAVLSGPTAEIDKAEAVFRGLGLRGTRLPVAAAFHSGLVADAAGPFRAALDGVPFAAAAVPVFANTTAAEYPADPAAAKDLLANQLARPVAWVEEVRALAAAGCRTFLEVGPGGVLARLADATLTDPAAPVADADVFAVDASGGKKPGLLDLGSALARLAARGHAVRLAAWEAGGRCRPPAVNPKPGMTVALCGANHVAPRAPRPPRPAAAPTTTNGTGRPPTTAGTAAPRVTPMSDPLPPADAGSLADALHVTQQSLAALQRMQEQTAQLHRQFLESQEAAQRTLQGLVDQQQTLLAQSFGLAPAAAPAAVAAPRPTPLPVPAPRPAPVPAPVAAPKPAPVAPPAPKPAAVAAPKPPPPPPAPAKPTSRIRETLLAVVSEKTGYPADSLDLALSLDADLGIDSIKRVEILSALQDRLPDAPVVKPEHLGTLHTLQDVADFLAGGAGANGTPAAAGADDDPPRTVAVGKEGLILLSRGDMAPPAPARPRADTAAIRETLLAVVSEKTGYPADSLDLALSLDADLGIDSIKRVEILSALQDRLPDAPVVKPEHLGTLHTLQDVADFLAGGAAAAAPPTTKLPFVPTAVPDANGSGSPSELLAPKTEHVSKIGVPVVTDSLLRESGAIPAPPPRAVPRPPTPPRGVPALPVRPAGDPRPAVAPTPAATVDRSIVQAVDLDVTQPRPRLNLPAGADVWVVGEPDALSEQVVDRLAAAGFNAKLMGWGGPGGNRPAGPLAGLVLLAPARPGPDSGVNRQALLWLQQAGPKLRQTGRQSAAVLATVARLDGMFGLAPTLSPDADPTAGGLAGILKTAKHEWPEVSCKAIDLAPEFADVAAAAAAVADEVLTAGPLEVGIAPTHRCTLELARTVRRPTSQAVALGAADVVLVTGGARGVTAEAAVALAQTYQCTLILTGRTPPPPPTDPDYLAGVADEAGLKRAIAAHLGADAGPRQIGEHYQRVAAQREVRRTLQRCADAGARVAYFPVDVGDGRAVADLLHKVRVKHGPVTAVVHGAGVLADKRIEDLPADDFDRVYSTKVDGLRNLLDLLAHEELKALVLFSSSTARFGRLGQAAYAAANEVLNKTAQVEARRRPGCRVAAVNWGPWDGGMVTPGLRRLFDAEGVGLIPLADGGQFMVQELNAAGKAVEVVAIGKAKPAGSGSGMHPVPPGLLAATPPPAGNTPAPPAVVSPPNPTPPAEVSLAFERPLDVGSHPVLRSHVLDGRAVLPLALHLEWLAHAALHGNPGLAFHGFNDLRVTHGVQVEGGATAALRAFAGKAVRQDRLFAVPVELRGRRRDGREVIHSRAEIVLAAGLPKPPAADRPPAVGPYPFAVDQAYREFLFHGRDLHGIERVDGASDAAIVGTVFPAPPPADWFAAPLRSGWVADPLVLDASFQLMILWSQSRHGQGSLPCFAGRYRQFRKNFPAGGVRVVARVTRDDGKFARADIDYLDADGQMVAQLQDYECVIEESLNKAFRRNQLAAVKQ